MQIETSRNAVSLSTNRRGVVAMVAATVASALFATATHAASLAYEGFGVGPGGYTAGASVIGDSGGSGWGGAWAAGAPSEGYLQRTDAGNVTYPGQLPPSNGLLNLAAGFGGPADNFASRQLAASYGATGTTTWGSFSFGATSESRGTATQRSNDPLHFYLQQVGVGNLLNYALPNDGPTDLDADGPGNFVLFRVTGGATNDTVDFYVNPTLATFDPSTATPTATLTTSALTFNSLAFSIHNSADGNQGSIDEIRLGTSLQDVAAVPEPTTAAFCAVTGCGLLSRRRRRRA